MYMCVSALYRVLDGHQYWSDVLPLSYASYVEFKIVLEIFSDFTAFNGQSIWFSPGATCLIFSDASSTGYNGYCAVQIGNEIAHGQWSEYEVALVRNQDNVPMARLMYIVWPTCKHKLVFVSGCL